MTSISDISILMRDAQNQLITHMDMYGFIYPTIILFNKDRVILPVDIKEKYPSILVMEGDTEESAKGCIISDIYRTVITVKLQSDEDEKALLDMVKEIASRYEPDGIGLILQCTYREMSKSDAPGYVKDIALDPEAIRVIHSSFFVKEDREHAFYRITPYIVKDNEKEEVFKLDDEKSYTVIKADGYWIITDDSSFTLKITNPYQL